MKTYDVFNVSGAMLRVEGADERRDLGGPVRFRSKATGAQISITAIDIDETGQNVTRLHTENSSFPADDFEVVTPKATDA